jgi:hypothetical protein
MTDIVERLPPLKPLPDCMMPDGAQPCTAFSNLEAEIESLQALLKRHDECWHLLHEREYTGALRDDTRAALGDEKSTGKDGDAT